MGTFHTRMAVFLVVTILHLASTSPVHSEESLDKTENCKNICEQCGCTGFYCGEECICECNDTQDDADISCVSTMQKNCEKLNLPFEVLIQGPSGNRFVRSFFPININNENTEQKTRSTIRIYKPNSIDSTATNALDDVESDKGDSKIGNSLIQPSDQYPIETKIQEIMGNTDSPTLETDKSIVPDDGLSLRDFELESTTEVDTSSEIVPESNVPKEQEQDNSNGDPLGQDNVQNSDVPNVETAIELTSEQNSLTKAKRNIAAEIEKQKLKEEKLEAEKLEKKLIAKEIEILKEEELIKQIDKDKWVDDKFLEKFKLDAVEKAEIFKAQFDEVNSKLQAKFLEDKCYFDDNIKKFVAFDGIKQLELDDKFLQLLKLKEFDDKIVTLKLKDENLKKIIGLELFKDIKFGDKFTEFDLAKIDLQLKKLIGLELLKAKDFKGIDLEILKTEAFKEQLKKTMTFEFIKDIELQKKFKIWYDIALEQFIDKLKTGDFVEAFKQIELQKDFQLALKKLKDFKF